MDYISVIIVETIGLPNDLTVKERPASRPPGGARASKSCQKSYCEERKIGADLFHSSDLC